MLPTPPPARSRAPRYNLLGLLGVGLPLALYAALSSSQYAHGRALLLFLACALLLAAVNLLISFFLFFTVIRRRSPAPYLLSAVLVLLVGAGVIVGAFVLDPLLFSFLAY